MRRICTIEFESLWVGSARLRRAVGPAKRRQLKRCSIDSDLKPSGSRGRTVGWPAPSHEAVPARLFAQHVHQLHADGGAGLLRDWQTLQTAQTLTDETQTKLVEQVDGRMMRVPLPSRLYRARTALVPPAYHVDGYRRARAFIVTERPGPGTSSEGFWRLIWDQGVTTTVSIGAYQASVTSRLPPEAGQARPCGDLELRCIGDHLQAGCEVSEVVITKRKKERRLIMYQFTDCTESGLPDDPLPLLQLVRRTQVTAEVTATTTATATAAPPVLVVTGLDGRGAGLYVGLATLLTQLSRNQELAVLSYCQHIVGQCPRLLGTLEEYSLLHECLLERVSVGETLVPRDSAQTYTERLQGGGRHSFPYPTAETQYKSVIALGARHFTVVSAAKPCNEAKNRSLSFIPMEPSRVLLPGDAALEGASYINASWLPGYRVMREYILTQHPLPSTVIDFWQMVWHYRITTVACLSPEVCVGCGVFWPSEEEVIRGSNFVVRYMSESADCSATYKTSWVIRSFLLQSTAGTTDDVTARVVHLPLWPEECSLDSVMEGVVGVRNIQGDRLNPLVVVDKYGGTEGASFCLLSTVLRQLEQEASFDIFTFAKLYHQRRPGIWKNMREYLYLYHAVREWLTSRGHGTLRRAGSCTSLCENRTPTEVSVTGLHGVMV
ncbi:Tyrosine-protein phosphatase 99A [Amphibalanus amphitrite]|uniref:Tyrosine-protein phosphatase 99A n=1 Tax=Amphibalanus amphitrite TaxID=1232801 RepID=A0A6A4WKA1_AMPAM|nr:Tyrosine-protein phosphatase 99A [Amphibalanus amphitrite]